MASHLHSYRTIKEPAVANSSKDMITYFQLIYHTEEVRILALHSEAIWILSKVVKHIVELSFSHEYGILIARGE